MEEKISKTEEIEGNEQRASCGVGASGAQQTQQHRACAPSAGRPSPPPPSPSACGADTAKMGGVQRLLAENNQL